jgi:peptide/nickel transport system ATP-binding protein
MIKSTREHSELLLEMTGLRIEAKSELGWNEIVHGVDLDLRRGEVLGLIGESGAGKSTIGLAAMGFSRDGCRISGGSITFDGKDLTSSSEEELRHLRGRRIAYVAQSAAAAFNPAHRLIDQYAEGPIHHRVASRAAAVVDAENMFRKLQLPEPETIGFRYPHQVSGGQLQRVMSAMAMSCRPDLIVFDEPTTALDVTTQIEVLIAIRNMVRQFNTAAIYITHDLAVVAQMAHRIVVLRRGEVVESGTSEEILSKPSQVYTRALVKVREYKRLSKGPSSADIPLLSVEGIHARYSNNVPVLTNFNLELGRRRTIAIVGESGSGKSTLARVITGLLPPCRGLIRFKGEELSPHFRNRSDNQLRQIQMISQMPDVALNPRQQVKDTIGRPLQVYQGLRGRELISKIDEHLEMIELPSSMATRYPGELSGGEKQRVCIARAIAASPEVIICDEVTSALDQLVEDGILCLLKRLQDLLSVSYLFITHDLATVEAVADEVVVMLKGEVVESGSLLDVFSPPHHQYTNLLLSSVPKMNVKWLDNLQRARETSTGK